MPIVPGPIDLNRPFRLEIRDQGEYLSIVELVAKARHYATQLNATFLDGAGQLLNLDGPVENHTRRKLAINAG